MKLEIEKLKLNKKPSEITSLEEINDDGDLAEDTKWVQVQSSRKKRKFTKVNSPEQYTENKDKASSSASHSQK
jgi:saccharopine dehydrogenase-like NADP-dependent oxidoreductase